MTVKIEKFTINTNGFGDIIDITSKVENFISYFDIKEGLVNVSILASSASVFTLEYEPGIISDLKNILEELFPIDGQYKHNKKWQNNNAFSHLRATFLRNNITLPVVNNEIKLDVWQKIVLADFDSKSRTREIFISAAF